ncbi:MAG: hypothetical protein PHT12_04390 [Patescibacteria group bacterium]|nr:hypothetical protein [Patescibacteria group bacterium]
MAADIGSIMDSVTDPVTHTAYFAASGSLPMIVRVHLDTFTHNASTDRLDLTSEGIVYISSAFIDPDGDYVYFVGYDADNFMKIIKIDTSDFTADGVTVFSLAEDDRYVDPGAAVTDGTFAYLGAETGIWPPLVDGSIIKVNLTTGAETVVELDGTGGCPGMAGVNSALIDTSGPTDYAYFTSAWRYTSGFYPAIDAVAGTVLKVDLSDFSNCAAMDTLVLEDSSNFGMSYHPIPTSGNGITAAIDTTNHKAYFGAVYDYFVARVDLTTFTYERPEWTPAGCDPEVDDPCVFAGNDLMHADSPGNMGSAHISEVGGTPHLFMSASEGSSGAVIINLNTFAQVPNTMAITSDLYNYPYDNATFDFTEGYMYWSPYEADPTGIARFSLASLLAGGDGGFDQDNPGGDFLSLADGGGGLSGMSDAMSSYVVNTASSQVITFTTASAWDAGDTVTLDMSAVADVTSFALTDVDVYAGAEKTLVSAGCAADEITVTEAADVITLALCAGSTQIAAGQVVIDLGAAATTGGGGNSAHFTNVGTAGAHNVVVAGTLGDTGNIGVTLTSGPASGMSDKMSRSMISTASSHTVLFTRYSAWHAGDTITLNLANIAVVSSFAAVTDVDVEAPVATDKTVVAAGCAANEIEVTAAANIITLTLCAGSDTIAAGTTMVQIGSAATTDGTGSDAHFMNVGSTGSKPLILGGTAGDIGTLYISLMTNDQIQVTADITSALTFDVDTLDADACTSAKPDGGYSVGLGTLTPGTAKTADKHICMLLDSNASDGVVVQVKSLNEGLLSASVAHTILGTYNAGATTDLSGAVEAYGICVLDTTKAPGSAGADPQQILPYNGSCAIDSATNAVGGVDNADFQTMVNTSGAPLDGDGYNTVDALVSAKALSTTPAAVDYTDTLTFRATGTF